MKPKAKILIVLAIVLVVVAAVWILKRRKKEEITETVSTAMQPVVVDNEKSPAGQTKGGNTSVFPLKKGSRGNEVLNLQKSINYLYGNGGSVLGEDGVFGNNTEAFLTKYFKRNKVSESLYGSLFTMSKNGKSFGITSEDLFEFYTKYKDKPNMIQTAMKALYDNRTDLMQAAMNLKKF